MHQERGFLSTEELQKLAVRETPYRSPIVISDVIKDILRDKIVCDLGCAEGDNMMFMSRYAKTVIGVEQNPWRYKHAVSRGYNVIVGDYLLCEIPEADVYYFWPSDGPHDNEILVQRIMNTGRKCTVIIAGDTGFPSEVPTIYMLANKYKGRVLEVDFNEGTGHRQSGKFLLCILNLGEETCDHCN